MGWHGSQALEIGWKWRRRNLARSSSLGRNRRDTHTHLRNGFWRQGWERSRCSLLLHLSSLLPFSPFHLCHPKSSSNRLAELRRKWRLSAQFEKQAGRPSAVLFSSALRNAWKNILFSSQQTDSDSFAPRKRCCLFQLSNLPRG